MLVLVNKDELRVLKKELWSCFPKSLKVHGAVLNVCQGNAFHQEILVDSWPTFQVVIARLQREKVPSERNYFTQSCAVFYKDLDAYEKLVKESDAIDWKKEFLLQGLQDGVYQTSQNLAAAKHFSTKLVTRTQVFVVQKPLNLSSFTPTYVPLYDSGVAGSKQYKAGDIYQCTSNLEHGAHSLETCNRGKYVQEEINSMPRGVSYARQLSFQEERTRTLAVVTAERLLNVSDFFHNSNER
ncbi:glycine N-acyltransferase-like protein 3 isoform X2 [Zootoca vivipara]|uniref:glycine N-acyltransferase-like protein 3 isoform X2 n=1 Tax=Zootoca vivipara TaxID=8524 RepID=UPI00293BB99B|nr:glycine N-acyltransferase-like protein 3 isoform X2 [Zootoca vivipara]